MKIIEAGVSAPEGLADITEQVREYIREVRLGDGFVHIQIPERTCAVTITINDDFNIDKDFLNKINRFLPKYNACSLQAGPPPMSRPPLWGCRSR